MDGRFRSARLHGHRCARARRFVRREVGGRSHRVAIARNRRVHSHRATAIDRSRQAVAGLSRPVTAIVRSHRVAVVTGRNRRVEMDPGRAAVIDRSHHPEEIGLSLRATEIVRSRATGHRLAQIRSSKGITATTAVNNRRAINSPTATN
jgi:hypothetical protein